MRVYRFRAPGIDGLEFRDEPVPKPGRRQVLVRMRAASLNYRDLMVASGTYGGGSGKVADRIPLSDGAGEIAEVGPDVTRVKPGDRAAPIFMQTWLAGGLDRGVWQHALGGPIDGVLADYVLLEEDGVVHLPSHLSFEEGATLPCAAVTAWAALYGESPLKPGQDVLVLGTGGVSIFALQFAHLAGARVLATSSSDEKLARARAFGAAETINYRDTPDWEKEVLRLTGNRGVDHVVEVGGAGTLARSIRATAADGYVHLIGVLTGGEMDPAGIMRGGVNVRGIRVGSRATFEEMNRAIALHSLRPVIDRVFPFAEARDAYRHLEGATHFGKVVIAFD